MNNPPSPAWKENERQLEAHFDGLAVGFERFQARNAYFHESVRRLVARMVAPGKRVLEVGCAHGELLAACRPGYGVGVDLSGKMVEEARKRHPELEFAKASLRSFRSAKTFDYILLSNLVDYFEDVGENFEALRKLCHAETRVILTNPNPIWAWVLQFADRRGWRTPDLPTRNYLTTLDIENLLRNAGFEILQSGLRLALPKKVPLIGEFLNRLIPRLPLIRQGCFLQFLVARPEGGVPPERSVSVVVPCYNEEGNVEECVRRIPQMGKGTEVVVVDDGSRDRTGKIVERLSREMPHVRLVQLNPNRGKGRAVLAGFEACRNDIIMILDADMTVAPADLPLFHEVMRRRHADMVVGTRLLYPMEEASMTALKFLGNKMFCLMVSTIMGTRVTDSLCGTKVFLREWLPHLELEGRSWGDFEQLFGAARLRLKIVELPIHYHARKAGESKMHAFSHGWELLKNCWIGLWQVP